MWDWVILRWGKWRDLACGRLLTRQWQQFHMEQFLVCAWAWVGTFLYKTIVVFRCAWFLTRCVRVCVCVCVRVWVCAFKKISANLYCKLPSQNISGRKKLAWSIFRLTKSFSSMITIFKYRYPGLLEINSDVVERHALRRLPISYTYIAASDIDT